MINFAQPYEIDPSPRMNEMSLKYSRLEAQSHLKGMDQFRT